ncbi:short-chain dehydrogenase [Leptodontidium sp. MPI-SDFR-AT-0119]|nr:short-chain dehydrogenase [Leptodontidium sp. MPI-SDFR-AT-0119]
MLSNPEFGFGTTASEAARAFGGRIRGKTIIITGISPSSIGSGLAHALASQSPRHLILASRTPANISTVTQSIHKLYPDTRIAEIVLDLSDLNSVRAAVEEIEKVVGDGGVDVLFNNAGINISWREVCACTVKGEEVEMEKQFVTNHLGPFLFTGLLLPLMIKPDSNPDPNPASTSTSISESIPSSDSGLGSIRSVGRVAKRIINTSSEAHRISPVRFSDIHQTPGVHVLEKEMPRRGMPEGVLRGGSGDSDGYVYEPAIAYGQSKTANVLLSVEVNRRFAGRVGSWAVSPGNIMTNLVRGADEQMLKGMLSGIPESEWKTVDQGAATLVVAGFDPELDVSDGVYLHDCQIKRPSKWAIDPGFAERLWRVSEELVGERFDLGESREVMGKGKGKASRL